MRWGKKHFKLYYHFNTQWPQLSPTLPPWYSPSYPTPLYSASFNLHEMFTNRPLTMLRYLASSWRVPDVIDGANLGSDVLQVWYWRCAWDRLKTAFGRSRRFRRSTHNSNLFGFPVGCHLWWCAGTTCGSAGRSGAAISTSVARLWGFSWSKRKIGSFTFYNF